MQSARYSCQILMELEFSQKILEKWGQNFVKICSVGAELFHAYGWTDRHDEALSYFLQFCERA
jgi:hypothetical protein